MVGMHHQDCMHKAKNLQQPNTYRPITIDLTKKHMAKLFNILRRIKTESGMDDSTYKRM